MARDEFNVERITNEGKNPNVEFGNTQDNESTSYLDNNDRLRDEVNDNPASNDRKKSKKEEQKRRKDKSSEKDNSSGGSSGSSAATSIATVASSALIIVPVLSTLVGINLFEPTDPTPGPDFPSEEKVNVTNLVPWSDKVGIRLYLTGNGKDSYEVSMRNDGTQLNAYDLKEGKNEFYFTTLNAQTSYEVIVRNKASDTYLYDNFVTTIAADEAYTSLDLQPDFSNGTFEALLACAYSDANFADFVLVLTDSEEKTKRYALSVTDEYQTITLNRQGDSFEFDFNDPNGFTYYINYLYNNEEKSSEPQHVVFDTETPLVKYTITLNPGESSDAPIVINLREGKSYTLPENPFTPPEGYSFKYWKSGRGEYNPGRKIISYLDKDYEFTAIYGAQTIIRSIEFSNAINFAAGEHQIPVTVDYEDPEGDLVRIRITFYNPNIEKREQDLNISCEFSPYDSYFYAYDISDMTLNTNEPIDYSIETLLESAGKYIPYRTGKVTFYDSEDREAHIDSLDFNGITVNANDERILSWNFTYTDTFEDKFIKRVALYFTPIEGGDASNIYYSGSSLPTSGTEMTVSSRNYNFIDFENGVYKYSFISYDQDNRETVAFEGIIDMAEEASNINKFQIYYEYYELGNKTYLAVDTLISDKANIYGDLTFYLKDSNSNDNPLSFNLEKRNGFQYFDISDFSISSLTGGMATYYVYSSALSGNVVQESALSSIMQEHGSTMTEYVGGYIKSNTVYASSISFNVGLFRYPGIYGTLSNTKLKIFDPDNENATYFIPFDISYFNNNGVNEGNITVPEDYEYRDELLALLKSKKVNVSVTYDCYDSSMGTTDTYTRQIIDNYYFSVR